MFTTVQPSDSGPGMLSDAGAAYDRHPIRNASLKRMLIERRRGMRDEVQSRIRDGRTDRPMEVRDDLEHSDAGIQEELDFALLQMSAETLTRIDEALGRLAVGKYRSCFECEGEIAERRLRTLQLAVRCRHAKRDSSRNSGIKGRSLTELAASLSRPLS